MAFRIGDIAFVLLLAVAIGLIGLVGTPASASAKNGACKRWGDSKPETLTNGQARDAIRCLINKERQQRGLSGLDRDKKLQKAAQRHNDRMDGTGCFSHQCPGEADLERRLENVDYLNGGLLRWAYGENVAWGLDRRGTPSAVVDAWMDSPGHRANILNPNFREIGVGFTAGSPQGKRDPGGIYTTDLGLAVG